ncbi:MAG: hypothetical protein V4754_14845 [Pseudomonadota bacterium]
MDDPHVKNAVGGVLKPALPGVKKMASNALTGVHRVASDYVKTPRQYPEGAGMHQRVLASFHQSSAVPQLLDEMLAAGLKVIEKMGTPREAAATDGHGAQGTAHREGPTPPPLPPRRPRVGAHEERHAPPPLPPRRPRAGAHEERHAPPPLPPRQPGATHSTTAHEAAGDEGHDLPPPPHLPHSRRVSTSGSGSNHTDGAHEAES